MSDPVSHASLRAAALAWPFVSGAAHRLQLTTLVRRAPESLAGATRELADAFVNWLQPRGRGLSLEALRCVIEQAFFPGGELESCLAPSLVRIAHEQLCREGGRVTLRADSMYAARVEEMRWMTLSMPADLLVAALYAAEGNADPPTDTLSLPDPLLDRLLSQKPAAETHLHAGAAFSFGTLWTGVVSILAADPGFGGRLETLPACPFGSGRALAAMLVSAAVARILLGAYLYTMDLEGGEPSFERWLPGYLDRIAPSLDAANPRRAKDSAHAALTTVTHGPRHETSVAALSLLFRKLAGPRPRLPASLAELASLDPLSSWVGKEDDPWPECRFATRALRYLLSHEDAPFALVFWQIQRVRGQLFRFLVEPPGTAGLDWFQRHYERLAPFRGPLRRIRFESALRLEAKGIHLGALEARTSPPRRWTEVTEDALDLARAQHVWNAVRGPIEVGLVYHFLKEREHSAGKRRRLHADPRQLVHGCRFGAWGYRVLCQAMALERALRHDPTLLFFVRGVDVASSELAVPTWATLPALHRVRQASERAAAALARTHPNRLVSPLRTTYHAGEEHVRLVEGLRRVHELIENDVVRAGDRIGHGTSLGESVERWARGHASVVQAREDRLDDLLWELDRYSKGDLEGTVTRLASARDEAAELGRILHGRSVDPAELAVARRLRHDVGYLAHVGFPFVRARVEAGTRLDGLVREYLTDPGYYVRGRSLLRIDTTRAEIAMLKDAQLWLCRRVASLGITVESNPSSNMLIGDLPSMQEHPSLRLCPVDTARSSGRLLLSINADDPVTFATRLADEMAFVYAALLRTGMSSSAALAWLGDRRDDGFASRFTLPVPREGLA